MAKRPTKKQYLQTKRPGGRRKTFAICQQRQDGAWETLSLPELAKVNDLFQSGVLSITDAKKQVQEIVRNLYRERDKDDFKFHSDNKKLFDKFWSDHYETKFNQDSSSQKNDFLSAMKVLGEEMSLISSAQLDIQKHINKSLKDDAKKLRRVVQYLNTLLKYAGRTFRLASPKIEPQRIRYLKLKDFLSIVEKIDVKSKLLGDEEATAAFRLFAKAAFATGGRTGEVLSIREDDIHGDWVFITQQLDRKKKERGTKNLKKRKAVIIPELKKDLLAFSVLPEEARSWIRLSKNADKLKAACKAAGLPAEKQVTAHQLRHSYAMHLLSKGVRPVAIADSIGDRLDTFLQYYKDYVIEDDVLKDTIKKLRKKV